MSGDKKRDRMRKAKERNEARERRASELAAGELTWRLYHSGIEDLYNHVDFGSVDIILTDPPYPREFLPCWSSLAKFADYALRDGGILAAMSGTIFLPQIFAMLEKQETLTYRWVISLLLSQTTHVFDRKVKKAFKVVFLYTKGKEHSKRWIHDSIINPRLSNAELKFAKKDHIWGQEQNMMNEIARRLCEPGDVVCDPFLGAGSSGISALRLGCEFIGGDIESECIEISERKLTAWERDTRESRIARWQELKVEQSDLF